LQSAIVAGAGAGIGAASARRLAEPLDGAATELGSQRSALEV
jgi:NADP-dependent 3-hydroxy acid dehydrogenase YdfG